MTTKEELDIALKEYDSIRKEIDEKLNTFQLRGVPLIIVVLGAAIGWRANVSIDLLLLFLPAFLMTLLGFSTNSWFYIYRAGRRLAQVEDKVFRMIGLPLLTYETELVHKRTRSPHQWVYVALGVVPLYVIFELLLNLNLSPATRDGITTIPTLLIIGVLALPLIRYIVDTVKIYRLFTSPFHTLLYRYCIDNGFVGHARLTCDEVASFERTVRARGELELSSTVKELATDVSAEVPE